MFETNGRQDGDGAKAIVVEAFARHRIAISENDPMIAVGTVIELALKRGTADLEARFAACVRSLEGAAAKGGAAIENTSRQVQLENSARIIEASKEAARTVRAEIQADIASASVKANDAVRMARSAGIGALKFKWFALGAVVCFLSMLCAYGLALLSIRAHHF
jgi:hypothetical protein